MTSPPALGLEDGAVRVVQYDPRWPELYTAEAERILAALRERGLALVLEHSGSTAIPGLSAKPILDILAGRSADSDRAPLIAALEDAGYTYRGEQGIPGRDFFRRGDPRSHHVHLATVGSQFWADHLHFRDYLRAHPERAVRYGNVKQTLAQQFPRDREAYIEGKTGFVSETLRLARRGIAAWALALLISLAASACGSDAFDVTKNLTYDTGIGSSGMFDVYEPRADTTRENRPAILAIHGGAWKEGTKDWGNQVAEEFCPYGYVVFSIDYRLSSGPNGTWPAQIEDVQKALRYVRANAETFRIDPERIASLGMSAGGHLATMVALRDDPAGRAGRVTTAVNLDGEHDMTMPPNQVMANFDEILTKVMGHPAPWSDAELRDISTVTFARPDVAFLTVHGAGDDNVYVAQGDRITAALREQGADVEYVRIEGSDGNCHSDCWKLPAATRAIHRFLDRRLSHDGNQFHEATQREPIL